MGKGTIISSQDDGLYSVQLNYNRLHIDAQIARLNTQISAIAAKISTLDPGTMKDLLQLRKVSYEKRLWMLEHLPDDPTVSAWCGDRTVDLTGVVGTIEVPGEKVDINIQPGYDGNAAYSGARDGALQYTEGVSPEAAFYNLAMLPGWQKWMPTYRYGIISALDVEADTCTVTLDAATSSQDSVSVNSQSVYTAVPISYMSCDSKAFQDGDHVLVRFIGQDYTDPEVIGFYSDPRDCYWEPWGATICARHNWKVETFDPYLDVLCPAFPRQNWSLVEASGNYRVVCSHTIAGAQRTTSLRCLLADNPGQMPNASTHPYLKIKVSATVPSNEHYGTYVTLQISCGGTHKVFWFAYARGDFGVSGDSIYVGDNGGEELTIDLSGYGLTGPISPMIFRVGAEEGDTTVFDCDYLTFSADA